MRYVSHLLWALFFVSCTGLALWVVAGPWTPQGRWDLFLVLAFFTVNPFGAFWLMYRCFRYEPRAWTYLPFAFVPYGFVWYYFNRVRTRKASSIET